MNGDSDLVAELSAEARRIEEDSLYSGKGHLEAASFWRKVHFWIGLPLALLAGVAGVSAFKDAQMLAGTLAMLVAAFTAVTTFLNPSGRASSHRTFGNQYLALRNRSRIYRKVEIRSGVEARKLTKRLSELAAARDELNSAAPLIPRKAYEKARDGIEAGEAQHEVDSDSN